MRKFFGYVIIVLLLFSFMTLAEAKPKKKKTISTKHKIEFVTRDKFILVGDLYIASQQTNKPLVVLLHSFSLNAQVWKEMAENLRLKGYNVLAMDLRGHGRSVYNEQLKLKSRFYYKNDTWAKLPKDVVDSVRYVSANYPKINCEDVIIVGADIGASAGAVAAMSLKKVPEKMVLISPMLEFKGIRMPIRSNKFANTKMFMVLAKTDRILMNFSTNTPPLIKHYPNGGPGNQLIKTNQEAYFDVINFITK
ncbi:MAG: alpha/beta fold hydrolase [Candidatus Gastranaerophilales bacterium]|nr:alpha/beta fold hydrolase [Candidatus Gastranaerophilales bacterium]